MSAAARQRVPRHWRTDDDMCGIAGFVSLDGGAPDPARLAAMIATLRHRGPDDTGLLVDGPAAIGAARLSIIDVAGGHQPMSIANGEIAVAQNGEIYNYVELRDELRRGGVRLATACDTEVIAHLYAAEGLELVTRPSDPTEFIEVRAFPFAEVVRMVERGEIKDGMTIIAVLHVARRRVR